MVCFLLKKKRHSLPCGKYTNKQKAVNLFILLLLDVNLKELTAYGNTMAERQG